MADKTRVVKILIDDASLKKALENAQNKAEKFENKMKNFKVGSKQWNSYNEKLQKVNKTIATLNGQLAGKLQPSTKQLRNEWHRLRREVDEMPENLKEASQEYKRFLAIGAKLKEIKENQNQLNQTFKKSAKLSGSFFKSLKVGIASVVGGNLVTRLIDNIRTLGNEGRQYFKEVELSADKLSSLTGLVGKDLEFLKKQAKELSESTIEGNVRITQSQQAIIDSYTVVGSQRPELLKNKEALADVTKQALILSEAAKIGLDKAVKGTTTTLNQFNLAATESSRVVNVLAAGSKVGAGDILYQATAMEKSGTAMKFAKLEIEEGVGLIETLAPRFSSAEMAGTNLKNVLLKLESASDKNLRPSVVGLLPALDNLKKKNWDTARMTQFFGQENINAATILKDNIPELENYIKSVTGTNIAIEQAAINTDNLTSKQEQAKNKLLNNAAALAGKFEPVITSIYLKFADFTDVLKRAPEIIQNNINVIIAATGAFLALNSSKLVLLATTIREHVLLRAGVGLRIKENAITFITTIRTQALTAAKAKQNIVSKILAGTLGGLRAAYTLLLGPIGLLIGGITALILLLRNWETITGENIELERKSHQLKKDLSKANATLKKTIDELTKSSTKYNTMTREELLNTRELMKAKIGEAKARLENLKAKQKEVGKEASKPTLLQRGVNLFKSGNSPHLVGILNAESAAKNGMEATKRFDEGINQLSDSLKQLEQNYASLNDRLNAEQIGDAINAINTNQLQEKIAQYNIALKQAALDSEDYIRIQKKIAKEQKRLDRELSKGSGLTESEEKKAETLYKKIEKLAEDSRLLLEEKEEQSEERVKLKYQRLEEELLKYYSRTDKVFKLHEEALQNELAAVRKKAWEKEMDDLEKLFAETLEAADENYQKLKNLRKTLADEHAKTAVDEAAAQLELLQSVVADETRTAQQRIAARKQIAAAEEKGLAKKQEDRKRELEKELASIKMSDAARAELSQQIIALEENTATQRLLIAQKLDAEIAEIERNALLRKIQQVESYVQSATELLGSLNQIRQNTEQKEINGLERQKEAELTKLEEQKKAKILNEVEYNKERDAIEAEYRKKEAAIRTQQFERQKTADIIQASINTALAITKTLASYPFPISLIPAALAAAAGGAQIAAIASQPTPQFGTGADLRGKGKKHSQGGILAELEEGEVVLSANTVKNNTVLVDKLLHSSLRKNGAKVNLVQAPMLDFTPFFTAQKLLMGKGGIASNTSAKQTTTNNYHNTPIAQNNELNTMLPQLLKTMEKLNSTLSNGVTANFTREGVRDITEEQSRQATTKNAGDA